MAHPKVCGKLGFLLCSSPNLPLCINTDHFHLNSDLAFSSLNLWFYGRQSPPLPKDLGDLQISRDANYKTVALLSNLWFGFFIYQSE